MGRYEPDFAAVRDWLNTSDELKAAIRERAELIANRARLLAPVRTGRYKASITVRDSHGWDGRVAADVLANVGYAIEVEVGRRDIHDRGDHVLRRAAEGL